MKRILLLILLLLPVSLYAQATIAGYTFEQTGSDISGNGHNLTWIGAATPYYTTVCAEGSYAFSCTVTGQDYRWKTTGFTSVVKTIDSYIYSIAAQYNRYIISNDGGFSYGILFSDHNNSGYYDEIRGYWTSWMFPIDQYLAVGQWYHLSLTSNGTIAYFYINNVQTQSLSTANLPGTTTQWDIGDEASAANPNVNIDAVYFYDYALTNFPWVTVTPTITKTTTATITPTITPTITLTDTPTITQTITQTITATITSTITQTNTLTITPTITQTVTETITPTNTINVCDYIIWQEKTDNAAFGAHSNNPGTFFNGLLWQTAGVEGQVWNSYDGINWQKVADTIPGIDYDALNTAKMIVYNNKIWFMGGYGGIPGYQYSEGYVFSSPDGINWTEETSEAAWLSRGSFVLLNYNGKMWLIGGGDGKWYDAYNNNYNDVWYSTDGADWYEATSNAAFSKRSSFAGTVYDGKMWIMGGWDNIYYNDVWYSTDGADWYEATDNAGWGKSDAIIAGTFNNELAVYWEENQSLWTSIDGATWTRIDALGNSPLPRRESTGFTDNNILWLWEGWGNNAFADVWEAQMFCDSRTPTPTITQTATITKTVTPTITRTNTQTITPTRTVTSTYTPTPISSPILQLPIPVSRTGTQCVGFYAITGALEYVLTFSTGYSIHIPVYDNLSADPNIFDFGLNFDTLPNRSKIKWVKDFVKENNPKTGSWVLIGPNDIWWCTP